MLRQNSLINSLLGSVGMDFFDIILIGFMLFFIYVFRSDKVGTFIMSAISFFDGFAALNGYKVWHKYQGWVRLGTRGKIFAFIVAIASLIAFLFGKKSNQNKLYFCKKCQKTFYFYEVKNLRCKQCFENLVDYEDYLKEKYAHKNEILVGDKAGESKPRRKNNKKRKKHR
ncbi:MAG: hypothetical protein IJM31_02265 [Campylobacter sp.]|nr:hypothetical protein [Campylobacter sp.]MBQ7271544.1 hypothetical protein [Campylobacter sp.]MBQ9875894.1 hypothetical protein [Campylobacter sp.]